MDHLFIWQGAQLFSLLEQQFRWTLLCSACVFTVYKIIYIFTSEELMKIISLEDFYLSVCGTL